MTQPTEKELKLMAEAFTCDPTWDYASIWEQVHRAKIELEEAIAVMRDVEDGNPTTDQAILDKVATAQKCITLIRQWLKDIN